MTLEEIQKALKEGKTVLDSDGLKVLLANERGYMIEGHPTFYNRLWLYDLFTIQEPEKPWPQVGDTYYYMESNPLIRLLGHSTKRVVFAASKMRWGDHLGLEKVWMENGEVFRTTEDALDKMSENLGKL